MFNHEPKDYSCPFCRLLRGEESDRNSQQDIVFQNELVTATIAPKWWVNNPGSLLVIPNEHYENIYDIPDDVLAEIYKTVKRVAIAIRKTYDCDGTSTRQHNEPAGGQDVWHFHAHVFPRYEGDKLYQNHDQNQYFDQNERMPYAEKLKKFLENKAT